MDNRILLHCSGAGDLIAAESHWTDRERAELKVIFWAARCRSFMEDAIRACEPYREVLHFAAIEGQPDSFWPAMWCFSSHRFNEAINQREYRGSSFLSHQLATIDHLTLPDHYYVVQPSTPKNPMPHRAVRDLEPHEWAGLISQLEHRNSVGLVLDAKGGIEVPKHPRLWDLTGQTTFAESIECLKDPRCRGYLGIDSCLGVLACQRFDVDHLLIRTRNEKLGKEECPFCRPLTPAEAAKVLVPEILPV